MGRLNLVMSERLVEVKGSPKGRLGKLSLEIL